MKRLMYLFVLAILVSGCASANYYDGVRTSEGTKNIPKGKELIADTSYKEAFKAVNNVFNDTNTLLVKKDFDGKEIAATYCVGCGRTNYVVLFEVINNQTTKIVLKATGMYLDADIMIDKIKKEIELQKKLKE